MEWYENEVGKQILTYERALRRTNLAVQNRYSSVTEMCSSTPERNKGCFRAMTQKTTSNHFATFMFCQMKTTFQCAKHINVSERKCMQGNNVRPFYHIGQCRHAQSNYSGPLHHRHGREAQVGRPIAKPNHRFKMRKHLYDDYSYNP